MSFPGMKPGKDIDRIMAVVIAGIQPNSPAARRGIDAGDVLLRINGHEIMDVLDYRFYMTEASLTLTMRRGDKTRILRLRKAPDEEAGMEFDTYLMDKQRSCRNQCVFCFIDQLPKGMRKSLYFKDDDSRLSFLFGNYVTLTNLTEHEIDRIIAMHISPINISVHTTNPELRSRMMNNRFAGDRLSVMRRLADAGIQMQCQLVLCPGINDGDELQRSMADLAELAPAVQSVAGVPVGLTKYREGLPELRPYTREEARAVIRQMTEFGDRMMERHGIRVFHPADEFYLKAEWPLPDESFYGDFSQLENGVGLMTLLESQFTEALDACEAAPPSRRLTIATGTAAALFMRKLMDRATARFPALSVKVVPIVNDFFGHTITVAGLVTGGDLIRQLQAQDDLGEAVLFPAAMLRREGDRFLDDVSVEDVQAALGVPVLPVANDGEQLLDALRG